MKLSTQDFSMKSSIFSLLDELHTGALVYDTDCLSIDSERVSQSEMEAVQHEAFEYLVNNSN